MNLIRICNCFKLHREHGEIHYGFRFKDLKWYNSNNCNGRMYALVNYIFSLLILHQIKAAANRTGMVLTNKLTKRMLARSRCCGRCETHQSCVSHQFVVSLTYFTVCLCNVYIFIVIARYSCYSCYSASQMKELINMFSMKSTSCWKLKTHQKELKLKVLATISTFVDTKVLQSPFDFRLAAHFFLRLVKTNFIIKPFSVFLRIDFQWAFIFISIPKNKIETLFMIFVFEFLFQREIEIIKIVRKFWKWKVIDE